MSTQKADSVRTPWMGAPEGETVESGVPGLLIRHVMMQDEDAAWYDRFWILHAASGKCLPGTLFDDERVTRALPLLAALADWTLPADVLINVVSPGQAAKILWNCDSGDHA